MISGVGTQREPSPWNPLILVAGERARVQAEQLISNKNNVINKLNISENQFEKFLNNWALKLSAIDSSIEQGNRYLKPRLQCNCRGVTAQRDSGDNYEVLNLIDILDIICNIGHTEFILDGVHPDKYRGEGAESIIDCNACKGYFVGMVFEKQWNYDIDVEARKEVPIVMLLAQGMPLLPFTRSWVFSQWKSELNIYDSTGWDSEIFSTMISELVKNVIIENPDICSNWRSNSTDWSKQLLINRYQLWLDGGADKIHAAMGVLLERATYQVPDKSVPDASMVEFITDSARRDKLVKHIDRYVNQEFMMSSKSSREHPLLKTHMEISDKDIDLSLFGFLNNDDSTN